MIERPQLAQLFARAGISKGTPSVAAVHTPTPDWGPPKRRRRRAVASAVQSVVAKLTGAKTGTYVGRMVDNAAQLRAWWDSVRQDGEPRALDDDLHCTVLYSRTVMDTGADGGHVVLNPGQLTFGVLGPENAVVLFLDSPMLQARNQQLHTMGATEDYADHHPHVTLFYLGADMMDGDGNPTETAAQVKDWKATTRPLPDFPIVLGHELIGPLGTNIYQAAKLPTWYVIT